jgi:uncharacterized protein
MVVAESFDGVPHAKTGARPSDETVLERFPAVRLDHLNKQYYRGLLRRELLAGRCRACERWHTPLRPICPSCWSPEVSLVPVSGRGTVHLLTFLRQGPPAPGVDYTGGFPLAAIELTEQPGLRVEATVIDCPRERLRVGLEVELIWIDRDGAPWPAFRPAIADPDAEERAQP